MFHSLSVYLMLIHYWTLWVELPGLLFVFYFLQHCSLRLYSKWFLHFHLPSFPLVFFTSVFLYSRSYFTSLSFYCCFLHVDYWFNAIVFSFSLGIPTITGILTGGLEGILKRSWPLSKEILNSCIWTYFPQHCFAPPEK